MLTTKFTAVLMVLVALGVFSAPFGGDAQEPGKVPRVGFLGPRSRSDGPFVGAFLQGLRELGWVEGQNIAIEYRFAEGQSDRLPDLAAQLVRLKVDVILATSTPPALAAKNATRTIPIVMTSLDPVGSGLVASLARPGGNITGLSLMHTELLGKRLELLKEVLPKVGRVAVLSNPGNPGNVRALETVKTTVKTTARRWACSFKSWRREVPTSSRRHLPRWLESAPGLFSSCRMRCSVSTGHHSRSLRPRAASRQCTD